MALLSPAKLATNHVKLTDGSQRVLRAHVHVLATKSVPRALRPIHTIAFALELGVERLEVVVMLAEAIVRKFVPKYLLDAATSTPARPQRYSEAAATKLAHLRYFRKPSISSVRNRSKISSPLFLFRPIRHTSFPTSPFGYSSDKRGIVHLYFCAETTVRNDGPNDFPLASHAPRAQQPLRGPPPTLPATRQPCLDLEVRRWD